MNVKFLSGVLILLMSVTAAHAAPSMPITEIVSPQGVTAWLVEDHSVPVISLQFAFRGGMALDPAGKAGLANLVASTLDEGAGDLDSDAFNAALEDDSIYLSYSASRDEFRGAVKTLTVNKDQAFDLLTLSLAQPRFDADDVTRVKQQIISDIRNNLSDPGWIGYRTLNDIIYAGHPYNQPGQGTIKSVETLQPADLRKFVNARLARDQLLVTVAGDITAAELAPLLDGIFGKLPAKAAPFTVADADIKGVGKNYVVNRALPQTRIILVAKTIARSDPDWYAATVMNYVLGGGGFNSRLMQEVREKRGLTYGVDSQIQHYDHANIMLVSASTNNDSAAKAVDLIKQEYRTMAAGGITADELKDAQTYLTGALPLALTSTDKIADFLMQIRLEGLGRDYPAERLQKLQAVTQADVARVAKRLLNDKDLTLIAVGAPKNLPNADIVIDPAEAYLKDVK